MRNSSKSRCSRGSEISESGEPGTWNVINFTGERGVFHYEGQVAETTGRKHMYIRAAFADGVTGKIEAKYILGGYTTETSLSLESGSTLRRRNEPVFLGRQ